MSCQSEDEGTGGSGGVDSRHSEGRCWTPSTNKLCRRVQADRKSGVVVMASAETSGENICTHTSVLLCVCITHLATAPSGDTLKGISPLYFYVLDCVSVMMMIIAAVTVIT